MNIKYTEIKPSKGLSDYVESYWHIGLDGTPTTVSSPNICIPKGTIELIVTLNGGKTEVPEGTHWKPLEEVVVVGIQSNAVTWRIYGGT
ncbi:hypothetical protein BH10BAC3_BH10BAC3_34160 [soil metagenome]